MKKLVVLIVLLIALKSIHLYAINNKEIAGTPTMNINRFASDTLPSPNAYQQPQTMYKDSTAAKHDSTNSYVDTAGGVSNKTILRKDDSTFRQFNQQ